MLCWKGDGSGLVATVAGAVGFSFAGSTEWPNVSSTIFFSCFASSAPAGMAMGRWSRVWLLAPPVVEREKSVNGRFARGRSFEKSVEERSVEERFVEERLLAERSVGDRFFEKSLEEMFAERFSEKSVGERVFEGRSAEGRLAEETVFTLPGDVTDGIRSVSA